MLAGLASAADKKENDRVRQASDFATAGDGSIASPWRGWEKAVQTATDGTTIYFANGVYRTDTGISITADRIALVGAPARGTTILAGAKMGAVISSVRTTAHTLSLEKLVVDGNNLAQQGIVVSRVSSYDSPVLEDVMVRKAAQTGILVTACQLCQMRGIASAQNGGAGIDFEGDNGSVAMGINSAYNGGAGLVVRAATVDNVKYSGGMMFLEADVEHNGDVAVDVVDTSSEVLFVGGWVEGGARDRDGFRIAAPNVTVQGFRISGSNEGHGVAIDLLPGAEDAHVSSNSLGNEVGQPEFNKVRVHPSIKKGEWGEQAVRK